MTGDSVDQVIRRMRAIADALPPGDGVAVFNRVYLQVTELVRDQLITGGFDDPVFMERLDVIFAGMYLVAVDQVSEAGKLARAWRPLLQKRERRDVYPVQFALAGMNAHINHDLALAVVATCGLAGREPPDMHSDYERINAILASVVRPIRQSFLDQAVVDAGAFLSPVADIVSAWSIDTARDAAWVHACTLWELRGLPLLSERYRDTLDRTVGLVGRQLLVAHPLTA
jgi:hypothetical protein